MNRMIFASLVLGGLAAFPCGAGIVHSPYAAFVANCQKTEGFSNGPQVDENGGIWTYGYRSGSVTGGWRNFSSTRFKRSSSELYGLDNQVDSSFMPYIVVNPTEQNVSDGGAAPNRLVTPKNEFVVQPGKLAGMGANCGTPVIRFTAPRAGRYSVIATCEPLSQSDSDDGVTGFHLLVNGVVLEERDVSHWKKGTPPITYTFNHRGILLEKGETIELATSVGIVSAKPGVELSYANDSSSVKIEVVEETVRSLGSEMAMAVMSSGLSNPFAGWTIMRYSRYAEDPYPDKLNPLPLLPGFLRNTYFVGLSADGTENRGQIYFCVNTNAAAQTIFEVPLDPNEVLTAPTSSNNVDVRFTTPEKGTWKITAKITNQQIPDIIETRGIVVYGLAGGRILFRREIGVSGARESATLVGLTSELNAGAFIDFVIDSRGGNANDTTGIKLFVEKVDGLERNFSNVGVSYATEMAKGASAVNPFTDSDGIMWEIGRTTGMSGSFTRLDSYSERVEGCLRGWLPSASSALPRVMANFNRIFFEGNGSVSSGDAVMYEDEVWIHPSKGDYGTLRYHAPSAGVYRVRSSFRDINTNPSSQSPQGVNCFVLANGCVVAQGHAVSTTAASGEIDLRQVAILEPRELYLREGEPIDFMVGVDRTAQSDATALAATIEPDGAPLEDFVNIDFMETVRAAYVGAGRIGWADPRWNAFVFGGFVGVHKSRLRNAAGMRTTVSFSLSRSDGEQMKSWSSSNSPSLEKSGVLSDSPSVSYAFSIDGLVPNAPYKLCFYSSPSGRFTVNGGVEERPTMPWLMDNERNDVTLLDAKATAEGKIVGTFASQMAGVEVPFFGVQVGGLFTKVSPSGLLIVVR